MMAPVARAGAIGFSPSDTFNIELDFIELTNDLSS